LKGKLFSLLKKMQKGDI